VAACDMESIAAAAHVAISNFLIVISRYKMK